MQQKISMLYKNSLIWVVKMAENFRRREKYIF